MSLAPGEADAQPRVRVDGTIVAIDFSADGKWMAVGHDIGKKGAVSVFSAKYRSRPPIDMPALDAGIAFVGFAAGGDLLAAADTAGKLVVWSVPDAKQVLSVDLAKKEKAAGKARPVAHPKEPYVGWLAGDTLEVARVPGGQVVSSADKIQAGDQLRWSAQGDHVLIGGMAWNWDTFERWKPKVPGVAATDEEGTRVVWTAPGACDGFLTIAEIASGKVLRSIPIGKTSCPRWLWFAARGLVWVGPDPSAGDDGEERHAVYGWDERRDRQRRLRRLRIDPKIAALSAERKYLAVSDGMAVQYVYLR